MDCRAVVTADFDDDGDVDLFVTAIQRECHTLLRNDIGAGHGNGFLKIQLRASDGHPDAIGAIVKVRRGDREQAQVLACGSGFESQSALELIFGLGADAKAEVRVRWPGRAVESFGTIAAGSRVLLEEGTGTPRPYGARTFAFGKVPPRGLRVDLGAPFTQLPVRELDGTEKTLVPGARPLLLNFWQTTCVGCLQELPLIDRLAREGKYDVSVICLCTAEEAPRIREIWAEKKLSVDTYTVDEKIAEQYFDLTRLAIPVTLIVSPDGKIERIIQGKIQEGAL